MGEDELTREELEKVALRFLSRRDATRQELRRALHRRAAKVKGEVPNLREWVAAILEDCESKGYLSDARYAAQRMRSMRRQGGSSRKIRAALQGKGVSPETIGGLLDEESADAEDEAARRTVERRRFGRNAEKFEKELASLARAGFGYDVARRALTAAMSASSRELNESDE